MKWLAAMAALIATPALAQTPAAPAATTDPLSFEANAKFLATYAAKPGVVALPDGLMYKVIEPGDGKGTAPTGRNDIVWVEYRGWLLNGKDFDRTKPHEPRGFAVGNLIKGWTEALMKMKTGQEFSDVVRIPAKLGYGDEGRGAIIPSGQTLIFLVRLTKVEYAAGPPAKGK